MDEGGLHLIFAKNVSEMFQNDIESKDDTFLANSLQLATDCYHSGIEASKAAQDVIDEYSKGKALVDSEVEEYLLQINLIKAEQRRRTIK